MGTGRSGHRSVRTGHRVTAEECVLNMLHCTGSTAPPTPPPGRERDKSDHQQPDCCCLLPLSVLFLLPLLLFRARKRVAVSMR